MRMGSLNTLTANHDVAPAERRASVAVRTPMRSAIISLCAVPTSTTTSKAGKPPKMNCDEFLEFGTYIVANLKGAVTQLPVGSLHESFAHERCR